ncbi:MAG: Hsp20/alpha crystallin family protein [Betaproteobacteria bacterium]|nr:Hsp20/alpha crystallin family protein [Betaproteobacteria bacterium]
MANLMTRVGPFGLDDLFDDLTKGFFVRPARFEKEVAAAPSMKIDVTENEKAYLVAAEVPGVKKDDIEVNIEGSQVTISATAKRESEEKGGEKVLRRERYYGKAQRSFVLPQEIDEASAQAKYADGVLELTLPKREAAVGKKLTIQ